MAQWAASCHSVGDQKRLARRAHKLSFLFMRFASGARSFEIVRPRQDIEAYQRKHIHIACVGHCNSASLHHLVCDLTQVQPVLPFLRLFLSGLHKLPSRFLYIGRLFRGERGVRTTWDTVMVPGGTFAFYAPTSPGRIFLLEMRDRPKVSVLILLD